MILDDIKETVVLMDTEPKNGDYTGEDGLLYCGFCHTPKEAYFPEGKTIFGRDRHPSECECRRKEREKRESEERQREHEATIERLKDSGFTDNSMKRWTFDNDNGRNPQMRFAHIYVKAARAKGQLPQRQDKAEPNPDGNGGGACEAGRENPCQTGKTTK